MASVMTCRVHPVVILSVVDAFERRSNKDGSNHKVLGTLLGYYEKRVVEITSAYPVPFKETNGEAELNCGYNKDMFDLMQRAVPSEQPVGWFSTSPEVNLYSLTYHDYYTEFAKIRQEKREQPPVALLTIDMNLSNGRMNIKAFLRTKAGIPGAKDPHCAIFMPLKVEIGSFDAEGQALDLIQKQIEAKNRTVELRTGAAEMQMNIDQMLKWIDQIRKYIDHILAGKEAGDPAVGRKLMELVDSVTKVNPQQFEKLLNAGMKDFLMISYLAQLAKTQLNLNRLLVLEG